jgi:hypothetical protein
MTGAAVIERVAAFSLIKLRAYMPCNRFSVLAYLRESRPESFALGGNSHVDGGQ